MNRDDSRQPPEEFRLLYDHIVTCGKCGFCQATCPIYRATGQEAYVARGKLALFRNMIEQRIELRREVKDAFANCLLCRACTENCFSAVRTYESVISFRHAYAERFGRAFLQRRVFGSLLPRPRLMRALVKSVWALRRTGLPGLAQRAGLVGLLNAKLGRALEMSAGNPGPLLHDRLAAHAIIERDDRPRIGYWMSCGYNYVLPEVGEATVRVLEALGMAVEVLDNCCCGLAAHGYGDREAAARLARDNLARLGDIDRFAAVVSECASCSGHLKEYPLILADDPVLRARAEGLAAKTRSFSELMIEQEADHLLAKTGTDGAEDKATTITYHEPCHLGRRYQNVVAQPRQLLRSLPGVALKEMGEADSCCGAAGTYGVLHPETSAAIVERKMGFVRSSEATVVATECPACMLQLSFAARRTGLDVSVLNVSQLCDEALHNRNP